MRQNPGMNTLTFPTRPNHPWRVIAYYLDGAPMYQSHHLTHDDATKAADDFRARGTYWGIRFGTVIVTDGAR